MNAYLLSGQTILMQCRFSDQDQPEMAAHVIVANAHTIHKSMAIYGHHFIWEDCGKRDLAGVWKERWRGGVEMGGGGE